MTRPTRSRRSSTFPPVSNTAQQLLPTSGFDGFALRTLALAAVPLALAPELLRLRRELLGPGLS